MIVGKDTLLSMSNSKMKTGIRSEYVETRLP